MRVRSFEEMIQEYAPGDINESDLRQREQLLITHPFSVITECGWMEYDNLSKWIELNATEEHIEEVSYGKTGTILASGNSLQQTKNLL